MRRYLVVLLGAGWVAAVSGCPATTVIEVYGDGGVGGGDPPPTADGGEGGADPPPQSDGDARGLPAEAATCVPIADPCAGKGCGTAGDGCGGTYACGTCGVNEACGPDDTCRCPTVSCQGVCCAAGATVCANGACAVDRFQPCVANVPCAAGICSNGTCYECASGPITADGGCEQNMCVAANGYSVPCP